MKHTGPFRSTRITRREALASIALMAAGAATRRVAAQPATPGFTVAGDRFTLHGSPFQVLSGEMHYARVPRDYWAARMKMIRAMGLNTLATYVFWNIHEPRPGVYDFSGNNDLVTFIKLAQDEGLHVLLRAGPYSCAEWEFGGFPAWLLADPRMSTALRCNDPAFMVPVQRWINRLAQEVAGLQIGNGGPILATQIENEYGNFSNDHAYMNHLHEIFLAAGFNKSLLYSVDPSHSLAAGEIDEVISGVNFGTGHAEVALTALARERPGQPLFATEYWPGWFDLWGHPHETRPTAPQLADLEYILSHNASLNIYMVHGGTSFGMMAGASQSTGSYRGNVTSYDYDAPIDEAGHPTPKFFAYRDLILKYSGRPPLPVPAVAPIIAIPPFTLVHAGSLWPLLPVPVKSETLLTMEQVGQSYGYIFYRTVLKGPVRGDLVLDPVHDYAQVYLNGKLVGTLDRHFHQTTVKLNHDSFGVLEILVENSGRLNSTKAMRTEWKGLTSATLDGKPLRGWEIFSLPMGTECIGNDGPSFAACANGWAWMGPRNLPANPGPHFAAGSFTLTQTGDTFLDVRSLGKGLAWINGHALGRFWNIGPQGTLYVPASWLKIGRNEVVIFELLNQSATPTLAGLAAPILDVPPPSYEAAPEQKDKADT